MSSNVAHTTSRESFIAATQLNGRYYDHRVTVIATVDGKARAPVDFGKARCLSMAAMSIATGGDPALSEAVPRPCPELGEATSRERTSPKRPLSAVFFAMIREIKNNTVVLLVDSAFSGRAGEPTARGDPS